MRKILPILVLLPLTLFGQLDHWARLSIVGNLSEIGISPSEEIWVATAAGNVYYTKQIGDLWHVGPFGSLDPYAVSIGDNFERVNFFDDDTLMISGFIQAEGEQDFVYWSGDKGKIWEKVSFGKSSWIDAAYINNKGKAWMSGSSQLIYYTEDKGKSWTTFDKVEQKGVLRFSAIHFAENEKTGLFGSFWNVLYRTVDNCKSWEKLPTPLSQGKYEKVSKTERPDIRKVRIVGKYYIINQQGRVFISESDAVNWTYLPDIMDFEIDEDENLFTINRDLSICLYDKDFTKTWQSTQSLGSNPRAIGVRNNSLFVLASDRVYKINKKDFIDSALFTDDVPIEEPYQKLRYQGEEYGFQDKDVLVFDPTNQTWRRLMTLDFYIGNATVFDGKIVLANPGYDKQYTFDPKNKTISEYELPKTLFSNLVVKELHFESGSQGCYHFTNSLKSYSSMDDEFVADEKTSTPGYLSAAASTLSTERVEQLTDVLDKARFVKLSFDDLDITNTDVERFKQFIDTAERQIRKSGIKGFDWDNRYAFPGENIDFDFYRSVADSLSTLSEEEINNSFWQTNGIWSTTTNWHRITVLFENGKKLIVENSDYNPNYLYTPWRVDFNGLKFQTNSIRFGRLIDEITGGQFFDSTVRDKKYAIFKIADYLYRQTLRRK